MSNVISDNLHKLIKSLTKAEKRYFKVFSSRHIIGDNNNYEVLFDAIDKQEYYDEEKLLKKFKDRNFTQRFSISKNRLYGAILKSLDSFHSESSIQSQLHKQLHAVEILYHKSLYDQCEKLLNSAKKIAETHECHILLLEINRWQKRILEKDHYEANPSEGDMNAIAIRDHELMQHLNAYNQMWQAKSALFTQIYRQGKARDHAQTEQLKQAIDQVCEIKKWAPASIVLDYQFNHIHAAYYFAIGDYHQCYQFLTNNLNAIDEHRAFFKSDATLVLSVLSNAAHVAARINIWDDAIKWSKLIKTIPTYLDILTNEDLEIKMFTVSMSSQLTIHAQRGEFDVAQVLVPQIEYGLKKHERFMSTVRKAQLYFNLAVILFGADKPNDALKYINKLLNYVDIDKSKDIHCMAQIFNLVIHLELGHTDVLPYALRSTQRFLETRNRTFQFESVILEFVNERLKKRPSGTDEQIYNLLVERLTAIKTHPYERVVFEYFDFLAWAKSKLVGKKFKEVIAA
jgi:hypothetical protein